MAIFRRLFEDINVGNIFIVIGAGLILFQIGAKLSTILFKTQDIRLGWVFLLIIGFFAIVIPFMAFVRRGGSLDKEDYIAIIFLEVVLVALLIYLKQIVPEVFSILPMSEGVVNEGISQLQSAIR